MANAGIAAVEDEPLNPLEAYARVVAGLRGCIYLSQKHMDRGQLPLAAADLLGALSDLEPELKVLRAVVNQG